MPSHIPSTCHYGMFGEHAIGFATCDSAASRMHFHLLMSCVASVSVRFLTAVLFFHMTIKLLPMEFQQNSNGFPWIPLEIIPGSSSIPTISEVFIVPHGFLRTPFTQYWLMYKPFFGVLWQYIPEDWRQPWGFLEGLVPGILQMDESHEIWTCASVHLVIWCIHMPMFIDH